jgi:hypothetical protein
MKLSARKLLKGTVVDPARKDGVAARGPDR